MLLHHIRRSHLGTTFHPLECDTMEFCQGSEGSKGTVDGGKKQFGHHNRQQNKESCGSGRAAGTEIFRARKTPHHKLHHFCTPPVGICVISTVNITSFPVCACNNIFSFCKNKIFYKCARQQLR